MKTVKSLIIGSVLGFVVNCAFGQDQYQVSVTPITGGLYKFTIGKDPFSTNMWPLLEVMEF